VVRLRLLLYFPAFDVDELHELILLDIGSVLAGSVWGWLPALCILLGRICQLKVLQLSVLPPLPKQLLFRAALQGVAQDLLRAGPIEAVPRDCESQRFRLPGWWRVEGNEAAGVAQLVLAKMVGNVLVPELVQQDFLFPPRNGGLLDGVASLG
jgi:hypothetical protein